MAERRTAATPRVSTVGGPSVAAEPTTVGGLLRAATARLTAASASPRLDAELLLAAVLGVDRGRLILDSQLEVEPEHGVAFAALVHRRTGCEPVAYLLGRRAFRRLELFVDRRVLIPRPETELLVEAALELPAGVSVLDVGTGSGAVALALADERPDLTVSGVDVSADAVTVARHNARRLGLTVAFQVGDLLEGMSPVDAVVANLPYVAVGAELPRDVAGHEPAGALFAGSDGLSVIRRLLAQASELSWPVWIGLEIGAGQGAVVAQLVVDAGFSAAEVRPDLAGRERVVVGRR